jgi:hypothetical protein
MSAIPKLKPKFVTNDKGEKTDVILSIEEYTELIEDLEDLASIAERREESSIPHAQVVAELKKDGYL